MVPKQIILSYKRTKAQTIAETQGSLHWEKEMSSKVVREAFKTHLLHEHCIENFYFWQEVRYWRNLHKQQKASGTTTELTREVKKRFLLIYDAFIVSGSSLQVNAISSEKKNLDKLAAALRKGEEVPLYPTVFDEILSAIVQDLAFGPWTNFLTSSWYSQHISQLNLSL